MSADRDDSTQYNTTQAESQEENCFTADGHQVIIYYEPV